MLELFSFESKCCKGCVLEVRGILLVSQLIFSKDQHSLATAIAAMERQSGIFVVTLVRNDRTQPHTSRSFFGAKSRCSVSTHV